VVVEEVEDFRTAVGGKAQPRQRSADPFASLSTFSVISAGSL
jgi:hypothetical protein